MGDILKKRIEYLTGKIAPVETLKKLEQECENILRQHREIKSLIEENEKRVLVERVRDSYKKILTLGIAYNTENSV